MFQSTRPRGARLNRKNIHKFFFCFNPRAHAGRDMRSLIFVSFHPRFNPRAHAGRDNFLNYFHT